MDDGRIRGRHVGLPRRRAPCSRPERPRGIGVRERRARGRRAAALPVVRQRPRLPDRLAPGRRLQLGARAVLPRMRDGTRRVTRPRRDARFQRTALSGRGTAGSRGRAVGAGVRCERRGMLPRLRGRSARRSHPPGGFLRLGPTLRFRSAPLSPFAVAPGPPPLLSPAGRATLAGRVARTPGGRRRWEGA